MIITLYQVPNLTTPIVPTQKHRGALALQTNPSTPIPQPPLLQHPTAPLRTGRRFSARSNIDLFPALPLLVIGRSHAGAKVVHALARGPDPEIRLGGCGGGSLGGFAAAVAAVEEPEAEGDEGKADEEDD